MSDKVKKINGLPQFKGPFREQIMGYIAYKRGQGYKLHNPFIYRLREMDIFFLEMGIQEVRITREMYDAWTAPRPQEKATTTQKRQNAIRGFAAYLVQLGYEDILQGTTTLGSLKVISSRMSSPGMRQTGCSWHFQSYAGTYPDMTATHSAWQCCCTTAVDSGNRRSRT